jgi:hypothetical protein
MRLFRRRKEAMEIWLAESNATREARWSADPPFQHAPDLDPSEVPPPERVGFDGRPLPNSQGAITGLESGGIPGSQHHYGG